MYSENVLRCSLCDVSDVALARFGLAKTNYLICQVVDVFFARLNFTT